MLRENNRQMLKAKLAVHRKFRLLIGMLKPH